MIEGDNITANEAVTAIANGAAQKTLVCFDFDNTIVNGHFHNALAKQEVSPITQGNGIVILDDSKDKNRNTNYDVVKLLEEEGGFKNKDELLKTFNTMFEQGHDIAITSFTKYPHVIKPTLKELGLSDDQLAKIQVIGGFPDDGANSPKGKQEHIDAAMKASGIPKDNYSQVMLIDDSSRNIKQAEKLGINVIEVPEGKNPDTAYLTTAQKTGNTLQQRYRSTPEAVIEKQVTANESITPEISADKAITPPPPSSSG